MRGKDVNVTWKNGLFSWGQKENPTRVRSGCGQGIEVTSDYSVCDCREMLLTGRSDKADGLTEAIIPNPEYLTTCPLRDFATPDNLDNPSQSAGHPAVRSRCAYPPHVSGRLRSKKDSKRSLKTALIACGHVLPASTSRRDSSNAAKYCAKA